MPLLTNKPNQILRHRSPRVKLLAALLLLIIGIVLLDHQRALTDWWQLHNYTPPPTVAQLARDDRLTASARRIFYVNRPQLSAKATFAPLCPSGTEQTVVLGCYHGDQNGIYVLQVTDSRLAGLEQVTAAHELLHAAYGRLSSRDRRQVDGWLMDYYQHDLHDQTILDQIAAYKKSEPNELVNEMHSLFGTQVADLPGPLEQYYARYFTNRAAIVHYYTSYETEFTSRQAAIKSDDVQLSNQKAQIEASQAALKATASMIATKQTQLNSLRTTDVAAYNAAVPGYNASVDSYNAALASYRTLLAQYNGLVAQRNAIVLEAQQLTQEITSQVSPLGQ